MRAPQKDPAPLLRAAMLAQQQGDQRGARHLFEQALRVAPRNPHALHLLGLALIDERKTEKGLQLLRRAVECQPDYMEAINNLAIELARLGRHADARVYFDKALALNPDTAALHYNRALSLHHLGQEAAALQGIDTALALSPDNPEMLHDRGRVLAGLDRAVEALAAYDEALRLRPDFPAALCSRAEALLGSHQPEAALAAVRHALRLRPDDAGALSLHAAALVSLNQPEPALESLARALRIDPNHAAAHNNVAAALHLMDRHDAALDSLDRALKLAPDDVETLANRAAMLIILRRHEEAVHAWQRLLRVAPRHEDALGNLFHTRLWCCDWSAYADVAAQLAAGTARGERVETPFCNLVHATSARAQQDCARLHAPAEQPLPPAASPAPRGDGKIRLGYVSADFGQHVMGYLLAPFLAGHDRARFEVLGFALRRPDTTETGRRMQAACDRVFDISRMTAADAAALMRAQGIDIAIDVMGYTAGNRPGIFARRAAPVQVNYLGFAGTMGAPFMDYILADAHVIPPGDEAYFTEQVVRLPDTFFITEPDPPVDARVPGRAELGLPDDGIVFGCINNSYKITPAVFDVWMRLLRRVDRSVLWLTHTSDAVVRNLRREAAARGVAADRLVFTAVAPHPEYLARLPLADLFLDTTPYNSGATASHALWMGVPLVTCPGQTMVSRMAASQLHAVGMPELIAGDLALYEALAFALASDPAQLAATKARLVANRATAPLFDHARARRHIEAAYNRMWRRHADGEAPAAFTVPPEDTTP